MRLMCKVIIICCFDYLYTVNQLLFTCDKFSRGLREPDIVTNISHHEPVLTGLG